MSGPLFLALKNLVRVAATTCHAGFAASGNYRRNALLSNPHFPSE